MQKVSHAGKIQRDAVLVGCFDHLVVANAVAVLEDETALDVFKIVRIVRRT